MTFNMYWLHHSINLLKIVPFLGGWLSDRLLGDPEGWPHPIVWFGKAISAGEKAASGYCRGLGSYIRSSVGC